MTTVGQFAKELGVRPKVILSHFPDDCDYPSHHAHEIKEGEMNRIRKIFEATEKAVEKKVEKQAEEPSKRELMLPSGIDRKYMKAQNAVFGTRSKYWKYKDLLR